MESTSAMKIKRNTIEELVEKQEMWAFIDKDCRVDKKTNFKCNTMFQAFQTKEFQFLLQDEQSTELSKWIYKNISKSGLHQAAIKTLVFPCPDVIEWMNRRIDHENITILKFEENYVSSYQAPELNQLYHFKETQVKVTPERLQSKTQSVDFLSIMKGWWSKGKFISNPSPVEWRTSKLRKSIQIIVILLERIFGMKDASHFPTKCIPIIHQVITKG